MEDGRQQDTNRPAGRATDLFFLIEYNRRKGRIVTFRSFKNSQQQQAENARLEMELECNRKGIDHEVVLLDAANEDALRKTHRRYFEDLRQILSSKIEFPDFAPVAPHGGEFSSDVAPTR
jgi:hypothetical protein